MPVLIVIERPVEPCCEEKMAKLIPEARSKTIEQPGCISATAWKSVDGEGKMGRYDQWRSYDHWLAWRTADWMKAMNLEMRRLQTQPEIIRAYRDLSFFDPLEA